MTNRAEQVLNRSVFEQALDALPDGVLLTDADRKVVYANAAFARHWNIPRELFDAKDEAGMLQYVTGQLIDPDGFYREVERIHPTLEASEDEVYFKDGRVLSRRSVPFEEEGLFQARIWIFTDITEARHARLDPLTGLPNRRAYSTDFPDFVGSTDNGPLKSVAVIDIDNFKSYNDCYGHAQGDVVLHRIGAMLGDMFSRRGDLCFRIGGEEFLVACTAHNKNDAVLFLEALREHVVSLCIPHKKNPPYDVVTASLGVGVFCGKKAPADVFTTVDAALYRAKANGRNSVCVVDL